MRSVPERIIVYLSDYYYFGVCPYKRIPVTFGVFFVFNTTWEEDTSWTSAKCRAAVSSSPPDEGNCEHYLHYRTQCHPRFRWHFGRRPEWHGWHNRRPVPNRLALSRGIFRPKATLESACRRANTHNSERHLRCICLQKHIRSARSLEYTAPTSHSKSSFRRTLRFPFYRIGFSLNDEIFKDRKSVV